MFETRVVPCGDTALQLEVSGGINIPNSIFLRELKHSIDSLQNEAIRETVCTYCTLMIHYRPEKIRYPELCKIIEDAAAGIDIGSGESDEREILEVPVCYGGEYGPDIGMVAEHEGISEQDVIDRHCRYDNYVYFLGFAPGHPYAGSEKEIFTIPRMSSPRVSVPKGSVNVWNSQTAVYGAALPTGWPNIGRTPYDIYDKNREKPFLFHAGLWLHFHAITEEEFLAIRKQVEDGTVQYKITHRKGEAE